MSLGPKKGCVYEKNECIRVVSDQLQLYVFSLSLSLFLSLPLSLFPSPSSFSLSLLLHHFPLYLNPCLQFVCGIWPYQVFFPVSGQTFSSSSSSSFFSLNVSVSFSFPFHHCLKLSSLLHHILDYFHFCDLFFIYFLWFFEDGMMDDL